MTASSGGSSPASADPSGLRHRPLAFVDDLDRPVLSDDDHHHLHRVLRVPHGAPITIGDGAGRWRLASFGPEPEPVGPIATEAGPDRPVTIAFCPVKGERAEWVVQKLTEIGVDRIVVITSERSVVRWDEARAAKQHRRLVTAAREACLQSRRLHLPLVEPGRSLGRLLADDPTVVLADPGGDPLTGAERVIAIGPEGGFSDGELASAPTVGLPGHILRAGTAALVAAALAVDLQGPKTTRRG